LMCDFHVDTAALRERHDIDFWVYFGHTWDALSQMACEGLINLSKEAIEVTPKGRFLIRNVCMVFDAHLGPEIKGFSKTV